MPVILATRDYARWLGERGHLRKNPGMNSVMTLGVVLAVFRFDAAVAQEGYLGQTLVQQPVGCEIAGLPAD
jgi:hypothetical protein